MQDLFRQAAMQEGDEIFEAEFEDSGHLDADAIVT